MPSPHPYSRQRVRIYVRPASDLRSRPEDARSGRLAKEPRRPLVARLGSPRRVAGSVRGLVLAAVLAGAQSLTGRRSCIAGHHRSRAGRGRHSGNTVAHLPKRRRDPGNTRDAINLLQSGNALGRYRIRTPRSAGGSHKPFGKRPLMPMLRAGSDQPSQTSGC